MTYFNTSICLPGCDNRCEREPFATISEVNIPAYLGSVRETRAGVPAASEVTSPDSCV